MTDLDQLRTKLAQMQDELDKNRDVINQLNTRNAQLAKHRSECLKLIARMTIARISRVAD